MYPHQTPASRPLDLEMTETHELGCMKMHDNKNCDLRKYDASLQQNAQETTP